MQELITSNNALALQNMSKGIEEFISFIDRGEKTTRTYIVNLRQFVCWLRYKDIENPTREDIISYRNWLSTEHEAIQIDQVTGWSYRTDSSGNKITITCKPNTVKLYLRSVCQFYSWLSTKYNVPNIASNIHAPKTIANTHRKEALPFEAVAQIENSIKDKATEHKTEAADHSKDTAGRIQRSTEQGKRLYAMYLLAVNCGLRTIELSRANIKDIRTTNGNSWLYIWGKGHTEPDTKKALAPEVKSAIDDYLQSRSDKPTSSSPLFVSTGNRSKGKRIAPTTISTMLKKAMIEAGYDSETLTAHSLRHTTGTAVMQITDKNIYMTQRYMRHSNPATTEIYLHENGEAAQQDIDLAQKLYNLYHSNQEEESTIHTLMAMLTPAQIEQLKSYVTAQ